MSVVVEQATIANAELIDAFNRLIPQLSTSNKPPTQEQLAEIIASPSTIDSTGATKPEALSVAAC